MGALGKFTRKTFETNFVLSTMILISFGVWQEISTLFYIPMKKWKGELSTKVLAKGLLNVYLILIWLIWDAKVYSLPGKVVLLRRDLTGFLVI